MACKGCNKFVVLNYNGSHKKIEVLGFSGVTYTIGTSKKTFLALPQDVVLLETFYDCLRA